MMHYVYVILNVVNYKVYVGQTYKPLNRWSSHKSEVKNGRLRFPIHKAMAKYEIENFQFSIVEVCETSEQVDLAEAYWIEQFDSRNSEMGYNLAVGGNVNRGWHHTEENKRKISAANLGKIMPPLSEERKQKISQQMMGRKITWADKISNTQRGKTFSEEHKKRLSEVRTGKYQGENSNQAKLTWDIVNKIRQDHATGSFSQRQLSKRYSVTQANIWNIVNNKTWIKK